MARPRDLARALAALALAGVLAACGGGPEPTPLEGAITATDSINPNAAGEPSPVVVRIYELKDNRKFLSAEFFELFDDDAAFLGEDLLGRTELVIEPGTDIPYERRASSETAWVGVIAGFRDVDTANWRDSIAVEPQERANFSIAIESRSISIMEAGGGFLSRFR